MSYSTFLLDLDHTLFDTDASEAAAFDEMLAVAGVNDRASYFDSYNEINLELWASVERGEITPQFLRTQRFERLIAHCELDARATDLAEAFEAGLGAHGDLYDGAREVVEQLSERVATVMITNGLSEVQRARIKRLGLDQYFDSVVISAEVDAAKPGTRIFDIAFDSISCPEKRTAVIVGDNLSSDIRGGTNYGIATCWYNPSGHAASKSDRVSHEIRELTELLDLVDD